MVITIKVYEYDGVQYTDVEQFRKVFKNISFPKVITDTMLMGRGVVIKDTPEPEKELQDLKNEKLMQLSKIYDEVIGGSVPVKVNDDLTIRMLFAEKDLLMVRAMLDKMDDASVENGVLVDVDDNVYMNLSKDTVNSVYHAMLDAQFNVYMKLKQYQIQINNAETKEALAAIQISF